MDVLGTPRFSTTGYRELVRRTYREAGKVRHETLANLSALPAGTVAAVEATLKGERLVPAGRAVTIAASLRAPAIKKLMAEDGPLQLSLFDEQDLAALTARVQAGRLAGAARIGVQAGKVINKYKTGKHFDVTITDDRLTAARRQAHIDEEAALDGIYVLRTSVPDDQLDAPAVVTAYKNLSRVERDFRSIKSDGLDLRPVFCRPGERVRAHVLICMLAGYLTWHLRQAWAPLTFTDENPPRPENPAGRPYRSFRGLLEHLATLTRNQVRFAGTSITVRCSPSPPAPSAKPSTSSAPRSRSP